MQMVENSNNSSDNLKQKYTEIYAEIREIIDGTKSVDELKGTGALSPKLRELIALGSAIATKRGRLFESWSEPWTNFGGIALSHFNG